VYVLAPDAADQLSEVVVVPGCPDKVKLPGLKVIVTVELPALKLNEQ
jgi:hypothetical protein